MTFKIIIRPGEDNYLVASVPSLPGCFSQGKTFEETLGNVKEAIEAYMEASMKMGDPVQADDENIYETMVRIPWKEDDNSTNFVRQQPCL